HGALSNGFYPSLRRVRARLSRPRSIKVLCAKRRYPVGGQGGLARIGAPTCIQTGPFIAPICGTQAAIAAHALRRGGIGLARAGSADQPPRSGPASYLTEDLSAGNDD